MIDSLITGLFIILTAIGGWFGVGQFEEPVGAFSDAFLTIQGGTGTTTTPTDGQLLIGTSDGDYAVSTLTAGSNVTITEAYGAITIASSGGGGSSDHLYPFPNTTAWGDNATTTLTVLTGGFVSNATSPLAVTSSNLLPCESNSMNKWSA